MNCFYYTRTRSTLLGYSDIMAMSTVKGIANDPEIRPATISRPACCTWNAADPGRVFWLSYGRLITACLTQFRLM